MTSNSSKQVRYRTHNSYERVQNIEPTHPFTLPCGQLGRSDYQFTEFHNHTYALRAVKC